MATIRMDHTCGKGPDIFFLRLLSFVFEILQFENIIVQLWFFQACLLPSHSHALRGNEKAARAIIMP